MKVENLRWHQTRTVTQRYEPPLFRDGEGRHVLEEHLSEKKLQYYDGLNWVDVPLVVEDIGQQAREVADELG